MADPNSSALQALVEGADFQRLLTGIDEDNETAQKEVRKFLASAELKWLPSSIRAEAEKDLERARKSEKLFATELAKVAAEKGQQKPLLSTFDAYSLSVGALQERGAELGALSEAGVTQTAAAIVAFFIALTKLGQARLIQVLKELEQLKRDLESARKDLKWAFVQGGLNLAISVASFWAPHMKLLGEIAVAGGKIGLNAVIDELCGPHGASVSHSAKHAMWEVIENVRLVDEDHKTFIAMQKKFAKTGTLVTTALSDAHEIEQAKRIIESIEERMNNVEKMADRVLSDLRPMVANLPRLQKSLEDTQRKVADAGTRAGDARAVYKKLRALIAAAK